LDQHSSWYFQALYNGKSPGFQLFNRFTVKGSLDTYNIDGSSSKKKHNAVYVAVFSHECQKDKLDDSDLPNALLALSSAKFV
jgi:hypothetical protein